MKSRDASHFGGPLELRKLSKNRVRVQTRTPFDARRPGPAPARMHRRFTGSTNAGFIGQHTRPET